MFPTANRVFDLSSWQVSTLEQPHTGFAQEVLSVMLKQRYPDLRSIVQEVAVDVANCPATLSLEYVFVDSEGMCFSVAAAECLIMAIRRNPEVAACSHIEHVCSYWFRFTQCQIEARQRREPCSSCGCLARDDEVGAYVRQYIC